MQKRVAGFSICAEKAAEAEVNTCEDAVHRIGAQILASQADHRIDIIPLSDKKRHDPRGKRLAQDKNDRSETGTDHAAVAQYRPAPLVPACARILRGEGRDRREHGARHQEEKADNLFHDPYCGGNFNTPAVGDHCDDQKRDLDQTFLQRDGHAGPQDLAGCLPIDPAAFAQHFSMRFFQRSQPYDYGDPLAGHSGSGGACRPHPEGPHQQPVKSHIDDPCRSHIIHRPAGVAQAPENG